MEQAFELVITGMENGEWQGNIRMESGEEKRFASLMEMIRAVETEMRGKPA